MFRFKRKSEPKTWLKPFWTLRLTSSCEKREAHCVESHVNKDITFLNLCITRWPQTLVIQPFTDSDWVANWLLWRSQACSDDLLDVLWTRTQPIIPVMIMGKHPITLVVISDCLPGVLWTRARREVKQPIDFCEIRRSSVMFRDNLPDALWKHEQAS